VAWASAIPFAGICDIFWLGLLFLEASRNPGWIRGVVTLEDPQVSLVRCQFLILCNRCKIGYPVACFVFVGASNFACSVNGEIERQDPDTISLLSGENATAVT